MGQVLHGCATTTQAIRKAIQESKESIRTLARKYSINFKTVLKWKSRNSVEDQPTGPKNIRSTVLTPEEEAAVVLFRKQTLLPLDDCLYTLKPSIPRLTRSNLHRCLQRHGISQLPKEVQQNPQKKKFKAYAIGYFHIDIAQVRTEEGKLYLFVAIDRTSKFVYARLYTEMTKMKVVQFLKDLIQWVPYTIHTVLTDNGVQFANRRQEKVALPHVFSEVCKENKIEHRLTQVCYPWTNGQVERMNRTLKEATVKKYHYGTHQQLTTHLQLFLNAYNFGKNLKALKGLTPYEYIHKSWTIQPEKFKIGRAHV